MSDARSAAPRAVVITDDVLGDRMAGPAIRAVELARVLSRQQPVALVSAAGGRVAVPGVVDGPPGDLHRMVEQSDVVVLQGAVLVRHPWMHEIDQPIVVDLYDPFHLEALQLAGGDPLRAVDIVESTLRTLSDQIVRGDFFLCASERQRDLWLGHLGAVGRLNHHTRDGDPDLRSLIDIVPFGVPDGPPQPTGPRLRELVPTIDAEAIVALWAGGIYDWFDPLTLIDSVAGAATNTPLHLVFMGGRHPNPDVPDMAVATAARARAAEVERVHFIDDWIPYEQRQQLLLDADIGVTTHHRSVETAFSFRTRMLDYVWAGLPIVCTEGDELSAAVARAGAGHAVEAGDAEALRAALEALTDDSEARRQASNGARDLARSYRWDDIATPLCRFALDPRTAPDRRDPVSKAAIALHRPPPQAGPRHLARRTRLNFATGGWRRVARALRDKITRSA